MLLENISLLFSASILFFVFGMLAGVFRVNLEFSDASTKRSNTMLEPCTQCGQDWNREWELIDTLYPSKRDPFTGEFTEWNVICQTHNSGCGRIVYGDTKEQAVKRWNSGKTDEVII
jgi:hypothetical protein